MGPLHCTKPCDNVRKADFKLSDTNRPLGQVGEKRMPAKFSVENPEIEYIEESIAYVKQNKAALRRYRWGWKYYLSAIVLCMSYSCWAEIFRKPLRLVNREEIK